MLKRVSFIAILFVFSLGLLFCTDKPAAAAGTVHFTSPDSGNIYRATELINVDWSHSTTLGSTFDSETLYFSSDGGSTWTKVESFTDPELDMSYHWEAPHIVSNQCKFRLSAVIYTSGSPSKQWFYGPTFTIEEPVPLLISPINIKIASFGSDFVELVWQDECICEDGYVILRDIGADGNFVEIADLAADSERYLDEDVMPNTQYEYRIKIYDGDRNQTTSSPLAIITTEDEEATEEEDEDETAAEEEEEDTQPPSHTGPTPSANSGEIELKFYINSMEYYINGKLKTMDTMPVILEGRTILPIRYVADALGAQVAWNDLERKVTVVGSKTIVMTIGNPWATVDGVQTLIDPDNQKVTPVILSTGRTMLPLRFIAENLGCSVGWEALSQQVTLRYPGE